MSNTTNYQTLNLNAATYYQNKGWNQQIDLNGSLLFFVDHGSVYDGDGTTVIGNILYQSTLPPVQQFVTGYPEILIVPVPGSCTKFYIISAYMLAPGGPAGTNPVPGFVTLDMEQKAFVNPDPNGNAWMNPIANQSNGQWQNFSVHCSEMHLACTEPLSNGNRWLFISNCGGLYRAEITANGIGQAASVINPFPPGPGGPNSWGSSTAKSELEVWETPSGVSPKSYRIAAPLGAGTNHIGLAQLDNNGNVVGNPVTIKPTAPAGGANNNLKGMEFSPDGSVLYITTDVSPYLRCYNTSTGAAVPLPGVQNFLPEFRYSMIERGKDQSLYVVSTYRVVNGSRRSVLGRIQNPNAPAIASFDPNWNILPTCHLDPFSLAGEFQYTSSGISTVPQNTFLNVLPDQIDGEDYLISGTSLNRECCEFSTTYNDEGTEPINTSIAQSTTWEPGNNPAGGSSAIWIKGILEVQSGVTLNLRNLNFYFGPQGKVIVHPGATLRIESCVLSGNPRCSTMWQGIEVWGDVSQWVSGEGKLFMSQAPGGVRSRIEQAITGIATRDVQSLANIKDGGFISVEYSDFQNNLVDVYYVSHPLSGNPSVIKDCNFTNQTGALWYPNAGASTSCHLWLSEVSSSHIILTGFANYFFNGKVGIRLNETKNIQSDDLLFEKCDVGIWSLQTGSSGNPSNNEISRNRFRGVHTCIRIENGSEDEISGNIFNSLYPVTPAGPDQSQSKNFYGVFLNACRNYRIADNSFNHNMYGIYIRATGQYPGAIDAVQYGNFFNECWRGIHTEGDNQLVQIRCNTFNNANQPASQFSTAWFVNGDLPNQGGPGPTSEFAAGNYFNRAPFRTDLNGILGNTATSCDPTKNFCYYYNQFSTSGNVNPAIGTTNTITKNQNPATQTGCISRALLMDLAGHDPGLARELIENESNPVLKAQYTLELTQWYRSQNQIDSVLSLLTAVGDKRQLYSDYFNIDSLQLAADVLNELQATGTTEDVVFSQVNRLILELKRNGQALHQLDPANIDFLRNVVDMKLQVSEQARGILYLIDSVYTPVVLESDTGSYNRLSNLQSNGDNNSLFLLNNPANDQLQFKWITQEINSQEVIWIDVTTMTGQLVLHVNVPAQEVYTIQLSSLTQGIYLLRARSKNSMANAKFSKL